MSGENLYNRWRFCMADEGVEVDEWFALSNAERSAWNSLVSDVGLSDE